MKCRLGKFTSRFFSYEWLSRQYLKHIVRFKYGISFVKEYMIRIAHFLDMPHVQLLL